MRPKSLPVKCPMGIMYQCATKTSLYVGKIKITNINPMCLSAMYSTGVEFCKIRKDGYALRALLKMQRRLII